MGVSMRLVTITLTEDQGASSGMYEWSHTLSISRRLDLSIQLRQADCDLGAYWFHVDSPLFAFTPLA